MQEQIFSLYEYGDWVTQRLLATAEQLTEAQFTQAVIRGCGSVHQTLVHTLGAETIWFARWQGHSPKSMASPTELPTVADLRTRWAALIAERQAYFAAVDDTRLNAILNWTNMRGQSYSLPCWQVILHAANHSTHHRSEVAAMLTELGHEPESTDLLEFYLARAGQPWKPTGRS